MFDAPKRCVTMSLPQHRPLLCCPDEMLRYCAINSAARAYRRNVLSLAVYCTLAEAFVGAIAAQPAEDPKALSHAAHVLFRDRCSECHGGAEPEAEMVILDYAAILESNHVVPNDLENSLIWERITSTEEPMPPPNKGKPLSEEERQVIRRWIEAGAPPFPAEVRRAFIGEQKLLTAIADDLAQAEPVDRPYVRYFSIVNLYNNSFDKRIGINSKNIDDDELDYARAGLSMLLNSLSWEQELAMPTAIGKEQLVYRIDLRDYGWTPQHWLSALTFPGAEYPYGVDHRYHQSKPISQAAQRYFELRHSDHPLERVTPYVRADWFINTASRGDLYYHLLHLPANVRSLEKMLDVDAERNILNRQVQRAGMLESGVSLHNRLVERHRTKYGAYWKSYDFSGSRDERDLLKNPLGPSFDRNPFNHAAFVEDGGEMIFNLPNGLQAYYLAKNDGERLNKGPTEIVEDKLGASGSVFVENAISCFACHDQGMKTFSDVVRKNHGLQGPAAKFVEFLYPPADKMGQLVDADGKRFRQAAAAVCAPWFPQGTKAEPVSSVAKKYQRELQLEEAAVELGMSNPSFLAERINDDQDLKRIGVGPLAEGGGIKRDNWERMIFPKIVREMNTGTPVGF